MSWNFDKEVAKKKKKHPTEKICLIDLVNRIIETESESHNDLKAQNKGLVLGLLIAVPLSLSVSFFTEIIIKTFNFDSIAWKFVFGVLLFVIFVKYFKLALKGDFSINLGKG